MLLHRVEVQFQNKLNYYNVDDTLLNSIKKKSLKEYDEVGWSLCIFICIL